MTDAETLVRLVATPRGERHAGRGVLISGGTGGLGFAAAKRFATEGAAVWILGRNEERLERALAQLEIAGGAACDVTDELAVERAVSEARGKLGQIDAAFVCAGVDGEGKDVLELPVEALRRALEVNVVGAFLVARAAARAMPPGGALVLNASVNGRRAEPALADYNASKAAAILLAQTMALDLATRRIAVTAICPGRVRGRAGAATVDDPVAAMELLTHIPAGRLCEPDEVAGLVSFLASPEAAYMTGGVITIDGGRSAG